MKSKLFGVLGRTDIGINIVSQCPVCKMFMGIVGNSKSPVSFNPDHVTDITPEDLQKIPQKICNRGKCKKAIRCCA